MTSIYLFFDHHPNDCSNNDDAKQGPNHDTDDSPSTQSCFINILCTVVPYISVGTDASSVRHGVSDVVLLMQRVEQVSHWTFSINSNIFSSMTGPLHEHLALLKVRIACCICICKVPANNFIAISGVVESRYIIVHQGG